MAAPKVRPEELSKLYQEKADKNLHEKKIVEALIKRLNDMIQNDQNLAKKSAIVLEQWLNKRPKP